MFITLWCQFPINYKTFPGIQWNSAILQPQVVEYPHVNWVAKLTYGKCSRHPTCPSVRWFPCLSVTQPGRHSFDQLVQFNDRSRDSIDFWHTQRWDTAANRTDFLIHTLLSVGEKCVRCSAFPPSVPLFSQLLVVECFATFLSQNLRWLVRCGSELKQINTKTMQMAKGMSTMLASNWQRERRRRSQRERERESGDNRS